MSSTPSQVTHYQVVITLTDDYLQIGKQSSYIPGWLTHPQTVTYQRINHPTSQLSVNHLNI